MNPDYYNSDSFIIWKIADSDGNTASFKVLDKGNGRTVIITDESGGSIVVDKNNAREHWKVYMNRGFRLVNSKCIKTTNQWDKSKKSWKDIHENDLQEMRMSYKDLYRNPIMEYTNYALEA